MKDSPFDFSITSLFSNPFGYFLSRQAFRPDVSQKLLDWLEQSSCWNLVTTDFYEQFEFSLLDSRLPKALNFLCSSPFLTFLTSQVEELFSVKLDKHPNVTAHKLIPGQRIRLHNDFIPRGETHRILIQLNRGWSLSKGGLLIFFNSACSEDIHKVFPPWHNSVVGFSISSRSYHAVSTVYGGARFTLVYSFSEAPSDA